MCANSWQYLYIPYTVFMVALLLYFVRYVHGYMKSCPTHKIFNRNTAKISYSCLDSWRNINSVICSHDRKILWPKQKLFGCNCRVKNEWPVNGECQTPHQLSEQNVINDSNVEETFYFGLADTTFKESYKNHIRDFKHEKYENST